MKNLPAPTWVYILQCRDGSYYTGCTTNLAMRLAEHKEGTHDIYTAERRPVKLIWSEEFRDIKSAVDFGDQIKKWSRKKKEALIKGEFVKLRELAQSKEMRIRRMRRNESIGDFQHS
jgi:putative endonuclease